MSEVDSFERLVRRHLDGEAGIGEIEALQAKLRESAECRERYWELVEWHALFRQWGEQETGRQAEVETRRQAGTKLLFPEQRAARSRMTPRREAKRPPLRWALGISAAAAVVALILAIRFLMPVATLTQTYGAVWESRELRPGERVGGTTLRLEAGAAVIVLDRGARIVLEGPAELELLGDNACVLRSGRVRVQVPESAQGFELRTPRFNAVDLGTEFGCSVGRDGVGEVHVFSGKVDVETGRGSGGRLRLNGNEALRIERERTSSVAVASGEFLTEAELVRRALIEEHDFVGAWRIVSGQLADHPATVLHYHFEEASSDGVSNRARRAPAASHGEAIGAAVTEGRWPGKGARSFRGPEARVEFALPGEFTSLSLLAWIRVDELHRLPNSLVMANGDGESEIHWFIHRDGGPLVRVLNPRDPDRSVDYLHSRPVIGPENLGSWVFVACVLDGESGTATHYLNGEVVGIRYHFVRGPYRLGSAEVGNALMRDDPAEGNPLSNLEGSIDEIAVLATALDPGEIARLYELGRPDPR